MKPDVYELASRCYALGHPRRVEILLDLGQAGESPARDVTVRMGMGHRQSLSCHLRHLHAAGLVSSRLKKPQSGRATRHWSAEPGEMETMIAQLASFACKLRPEQGPTLPFFETAA